jgi:ADP-L-glycero-D-manno-heptose 6-epimerase
MIVVTGAAGFIGSCLVRRLNDDGAINLLLSDDFSREDKARNLRDKRFIAKVHRDDLPDWLERMHANIQFVFHLGARTDTTEKDEAIFDRLNLHYSQTVWDICTRHQIPLIYASSAATYGLGELGYEDTHEIVSRLKPLNPYGCSKNDFDQWALQQTTAPPFWAGLKFFNVYGPNEYHKGRMASVIFHTFRQIKANGSMKLFRSHREGIADGHQSRDFVYVKDVVDVITFLRQARPTNGLYNLGTGQARTFLDLATLTFQAMGLTPNITFVDTPEDIRDTYQYFTEANMQKLIQAGYSKPFTTLEQGVSAYVKEYLTPDRVW